MLNHLFCWIFFFFFHLCPKKPPEILPVKTTDFSKSTAQTILLKLRRHNPLWEGRGNGWTEKWRDEGWQEVSQLSRTQSRPSTLLSTNDQRPWIPAAPQGQQLLPSSASLQALKGTWHQLSWLRSCQAEQQLRDGDRQACCASRVAKPAETLSSQLLPPNAKLAL